jgi:EpsI family protein
MKLSRRFGITVILLSLALAVSASNALRKAPPLAYPFSTIPDRIGNWIGTDDTPLSDKIEASLAPTSYINRTYRNGPQELSLFVAYYANQRAGESMHSPKYCMPGGGWEMLDSGKTSIASKGRQTDLNNYVLYRSGDRMRMLYWYQGPYRVVASEYKAKFYLLWDAARSGQTAGSIVRITTAERPGALEQSMDFAGRVIPEVERCFGSGI